MLSCLIPSHLRCMSDAAQRSYRATADQHRRAKTSASPASSDSPHGTPCSPTGPYPHPPRDRILTPHGTPRSSTGPHAHPRDPMLTHGTPCSPPTGPHGTPYGVSLTRAPHPYMAGGRLLDSLRCNALLTSPPRLRLHAISAARSAHHALVLWALALHHAQTSVRGMRAAARYFNLNLSLAPTLHYAYTSHPIPSHPIPSHLIPSHPIPSHPIPSHPIPS
jgi:hypothetical protein